MLNIYFAFCVQMYSTQAVCSFFLTPILQHLAILVMSSLHLYCSSAKIYCGSLKAIVLQVHVGLSQVPLIVKGHVNVASSPNVLLLMVLHDLYMDTLTLIHRSILLFSKSHLPHPQ
jgi:hypothetical protein